MKRLRLRWLALSALFLAACAGAVTPQATPTPPSFSAPSTPSPPPPTAAPTETWPLPTSAETRIRADILDGFRSDALDNTRTVYIYLPPGYARTQRRYPVLYANDGQGMGDLRLRATLEQLYADGRIEPILAVAASATADRSQEYGVAGIPSADGHGVRADLYTRFVLEELKPYVDENYRTLTGPENTAIMGYSLGGLMAFDLAWRHPDVFGAVGVFSGSFWWRTDDANAGAQQASRVTPQMVRATDGRPALRFWIQAGTAEEAADRDANGVIDVVQDTQDVVAALSEKGYTPGPDLKVVIVDGGRHDLATWAEVLPDFLVWAYGE